MLKEPKRIIAEEPLSPDSRDTGTGLFMKEHRSAKYQYLLLTGKLTKHLNQIDQEARKQVEILMEQMVKKQGATEELKAQDQMKWVRLMINIKSSAEEIVVKNTIYM